MTTEPQSQEMYYKPVFDENETTQAEAFKSSKDGQRAIKAHDKFMQKQMKKPRPRYIKAMLKMKKREEAA